MSIWFVGDTHFQWPTIAKHRGFVSAEEHDATVLDAINEHVQRKDRLFILGDFCSKGPQKWRTQINCREVNLIFGNHDRQSWGQCFSQAWDQKVIKLWDGFHVFLSHYPNAYWPRSHYGAGHLYGHTHNQREATLDQLFPGRRSMDVGVDALIARFGSFRPISDQEVYCEFLKRPGHDDPEFYRTNFGVYERTNDVQSPGS
ncbi:metallophosphoesterase family protein [Planctomicrobium sp. SH661]|uniref:metallophosphoesterase family protein n=1 Tax=Planctomicrobium sp. SH661 TaxID=3448124 RepID=UPI003F5B1E3F